MFVLLWAVLPHRAPGGDAPADAVPPYRLPYPPQASLRVAEASDLHRLAALPAFRFLDEEEGTRFWRRLPALGAIPPGAFASLLRDTGANDLVYDLLPPVRLEDGFRGVFSATLPSEEAAAALRRHVTVLLSGDAPPVLAREGRRLLWADSAETLRAYRRLPDADRPAHAAWQTSLRSFRTRPLRGASAWVRTDWLAGILLVETGVDLRARLDPAARPWPPALLLALRRDGEDGVFSARLPLASPDTPPPPASPFPVPGSHPFPDGAHLLLYLRPEAFRVPLVPHGGKRAVSLWRRLTNGLDLCAPGAGTELRQTADALRLLTGLHAGDDLLARLDGAVALGAWEREDGPAAWAVVATVRERRTLRQALRRAAAWYTYFARRDDWPWRVEGGSADTVSFRLVRPADGVPGAVLRLVGDNMLLLASDAAAAESVATRLAKRKLAPPADALTWRVAPRPTSWRNLFRGTSLDTWFTDASTATLEPERGGLRLDPTGMVLRLRGPSAPVLHGAALRRTGEVLLPRLVDLADEARAREAASHLRRFLAAQQTYRRLDLGGLNGRPRHSFAPSLAALVNDKAENGDLLEGMYGRMYDPPPEARTPYTLLFADLVRALAAGRALGGYRYRTAATLGGSPLDLRKDYALFALPLEPAFDPVLLIREGGTLFRNEAPPGPARTLDAPRHPEDAGWRRWR